MNKEDWGKLDDQNKGTTIISWISRASIKDKLIDLELCRNLADIIFNMKEKEEDTREYNSDECYYDGAEWEYINPMNKKQAMHFDKDGLQITTLSVEVHPNTFINQKSYWQKVESSGDLKIRDFIRFWNDESDKLNINIKGLIYKIKENEIYYYHYRKLDTNTYIVDERMQDIFYLKNVEKAVMVE